MSQVATATQWLYHNGELKEAGPVEHEAALFGTTLDLVIAALEAWEPESRFSDLGALQPLDPAHVAFMVGALKKLDKGWRFHKQEDI